MHRRQRLNTSRWLGVAVVATLGLTACGGAVEVVSAPSHGDPLCAKVAAAWPRTVAGKKARDVSSGADAAAAWGDPAIIARCGTVTPAPSPNCLTVDDVDWVLTTLSDGTKAETYGRSPAIEVLLPKQYLPEVLASFTAVARLIPQGEHRCS
ncbi:DUF3515 family protein [Calidifontibacter terrae]